jgi:hypothetical protein
MQNAKLKTALAFCLLHFALLVSITFAQFGHPLKGQWSGDWGPKDKPNRILMDLTWDGKEVGGVINPGTDTAATVRKVTIDYSKVDSWAVQIEADAKDPSGKIIPVRISGTLENLGAYMRVFHGTFAQGSQKGDFTVTRN